MACLRHLLTLLIARAADLSAETIGTFRWRAEPYCNVFTVTVSEQGGVFTLAGFDEACNGQPRLPVQGVAVLQTDGDVTLGLSVMSVPGGMLASLEADFSLVSVSGT